MGVSSRSTRPRSAPAAEDIGPIIERGATWSPPFLRHERVHDGLRPGGARPLDVVLADPFGAVVTALRLTFRLVKLEGEAALMC
jgi:hypothetical protein